MGTCPAIKQCLFALESQALTDLSRRSGSPGSLPCVVVVHSCKLQGHIKHEWEGYLDDVGQRCKAKNGEDLGLPPLRDKSVRAWLSKADKYCSMAGQVPIGIC